MDNQCGQVTFPRRWPVKNSEILQLYTVPTPNGQKVSIMLEEVGLSYESHRVDILAGEQFDNAFSCISPNNKIPIIIDPDGPEGKSITLMESGAILLYLAKKTGRLMPEEPELYWETLQWVFFQVASFGPMLGQFGHFYKYAKGRTKDDYGLIRYRDEAKRLLSIVDARLSDGRTWFMGDTLTLADMAIAPWVKGLDWYGGQKVLGSEDYCYLVDYKHRFYELPSAKRGSVIGQAKG